MIVAYGGEEHPLESGSEKWLEDAAEALPLSVEQAAIAARLRTQLVDRLSIPQFEIGTLDPVDYIKPVPYVHRRLTKLSDLPADTEDELRAKLMADQIDWPEFERQLVPILRKEMNLAYERELRKVSAHPLPVRRAILAMLSILCGSAILVSEVASRIERPTMLALGAALLGAPAFFKTKSPGE